MQIICFSNIKILPARPPEQDPGIRRCLEHPLTEDPIFQKDILGLGPEKTEKFLESDYQLFEIRPWSNENRIKKCRQFDSLKFCLFGKIKPSDQLVISDEKFRSNF